MSGLRPGGPAFRISGHRRVGKRGIPVGVIAIAVFVVLFGGSLLAILALDDRQTGGTDSEPLTQAEWSEIEAVRTDLVIPEDYRFIEVKQRSGPSCEADARCNRGVMISSFEPAGDLTCGQVAAVATATGLAPDPEGDAVGDCAASLRTDDVAVTMEIGQCVDGPCLVVRLAPLD